MTQKNLPRRPGRPKAVPDRLIPVVMAMYRGGLGYRRISNQMETEGVSADWSTIRRLVKRELGLGQTPLG